MKSLLFLATRPKPIVPYKTGQPMHETRRHILPEPGCLTPGILALEYYQRRHALAKQLPAGSAAIFVGHRVQHSSGSVFYPFEQNTDLFYLTGWLEPDSVAVIEKVADSGNDDDVVFHMVVPPKVPATEVWEGARLGVEGALDYFNADEAVPTTRVDLFLKKVVLRNRVVYWDAPGGAGGGGGGAGAKFALFFDFGSRGHASTLSDVLRETRTDVRPLRGMVAKLRAIKSPAEVRVMHQAGRILSRAINSAMARVGSDAPFALEKVLGSYLDHAFVRGGCDRPAYIPVVASGENALTIHYTRNDDLLYRDETVFVDAGGKLGGYCADISRAWPNLPAGFLEPQRDIYAAVLSTNKVCIDLCHEQSGMSLHDVHERSVSHLTQELRNLPGFSHVDRGAVARDLYPHYIGHHLGLDLHDTPLVSRHVPLVKGNVVTVEPGLYVPADLRWPKHYHGIGMRVEDDIAVGRTPSDILNLTSLCAKEVADVEALVRAGKITTPGVVDEMVEIEIP